MKLESFIPIVLAVLLIVLGTTVGILLFNMSSRIRALEAELDLHGGLQARIEATDQRVDTLADRTDALQDSLETAEERLDEQERQAAERAQQLDDWVEQLERAESRSLNRLAAVEDRLQNIAERLAQLE